VLRLLDRKSRARHHRHRPGVPGEPPLHSGNEDEATHVAQEHILNRHGETLASAAEDSMLLKFRAKDTRLGVTRDTVRALAAELDTTETGVVHMALLKLDEELLPAYEPDAGPLTARELASVRRVARKSLPKGKVLASKRLF